MEQPMSSRLAAAFHSCIRATQHMAAVEHNQHVPLLLLSLPDTALGLIWAASDSPSDRRSFRSCCHALHTSPAIRSQIMRYQITFQPKFIGWSTSGDPIWQWPEGQGDSPPALGDLEMLWPQGAPPLQRLELELRRKGEPRCTTHLGGEEYSSPGWVDEPWFKQSLATLTNRPRAVELLKGLKTLVLESWYIPGCYQCRDCWIDFEEYRTGYRDESGRLQDAVQYCLYPMEGVALQKKVWAEECCCIKHDITDLIRMCPSLTSLQCGAVTGLPDSLPCYPGLQRLSCQGTHELPECLPLAGLTGLTSLQLTLKDSPVQLNGVEWDDYPHGPVNIAPLAQLIQLHHLHLHLCGHGMDDTTQLLGLSDVAAGCCHLTTLWLKMPHTGKINQDCDTWPALQYAALDLAPDSLEALGLNRAPKLLAMAVCTRLGYEDTEAVQVGGEEAEGGVGAVGGQPGQGPGASRVRQLKSVVDILVRAGGPRIHLKLHVHDEWSIKGNAFINTSDFSSVLATLASQLVGLEVVHFLPPWMSAEGGAALAAALPNLERWYGSATLEGCMALVEGCPQLQVLSVCEAATNTLWPNMPAALQALLHAADGRGRPPLKLSLKGYAEPLQQYFYSAVAALRLALPVSIGSTPAFFSRADDNVKNWEWVLPVGWDGSLI